MTPTHYIITGNCEKPVISSAVFFLYFSSDAKLKSAELGEAKLTPNPYNARTTLPELED